MEHMFAMLDNMLHGRALGDWKMALRRKLTDKELSQVQWAYHKGMEARKQVIQNLFGRDVTYASCMAIADWIKRREESKGKIISLARPTENELWEWLCCAAYHGHVWETKFLWGDDGFNGEAADIRFWALMHCRYMGGEYADIEDDVPQYSVFSVPPTIPSTWRIRAYTHCSLAFRHAVRFAGPVVVFILGYLFQRIVDDYLP